MPQSEIHSRHLINKNYKIDILTKHCKKYKYKYKLLYIYSMYRQTVEWYDENLKRNGGLAPIKQTYLSQSRISNEAIATYATALQVQMRTWIQLADISTVSS